jgi:tetratricopeptide (TPR) repeat protein
MEARHLPADRRGLEQTQELAVTRALVVLALVLGARIASADDPPAGEPAAPAEPQPDPGGHLAKARELHDRGDFVNARVELLAAYEASPQPALLFALGQIEFNLHHFKAAIDYYQRFIATNPPADQAALALQGVTASRIELEHELHRTPPPPPPHKQWDVIDTSLVIGGGAAILAGGGLTLWSQHLANNRAGTLHDYDRRISRAETFRYTALGAGAAGVLAIGAALLRYQLHLVDTVEVQPTQGGVAFAVEHSW